MNAQEARNIAKQKRKAPADRILDKIKLAANGGEMSIYVYENLHNEAIEAIKSQGYKVEKLPDDPRDQVTTYKISWE